MTENDRTGSQSGPNAPGEFDLIETYFRPLTEGRNEALALTDDAGVLTPPKDRQLVVTTDALVAGQHFLADCPPEDLACKALGVNLSDLAAMGAVPETYTLALAAPNPLSPEWLQRFTAGLRSMQNAHGLFLLGGDTVTTSGPLTLSVTALGWVPSGGALPRSGAKEGDGVFVTGTIGDAALGLLVARDNQDLAGDPSLNEYLRDRYARPQPRCALGPRLVGLAGACADVSDGLVADLGHIAETSNVGTVIKTSAIPLSDAASAALNRAPELLETLLTGGDDYELVFTAPDAAWGQIDEIAQASNTKITRIGSITGDRIPRVIGPNGEDIRFSSGGYRHF